MVEVDRSTPVSRTDIGVSRLGIIIESELAAYGFDPARLDAFYIDGRPAHLPVTQALS